MSRPGVCVLALLSVTGCSRSREAQGERLARTYCAACHMFPDPALLDKQTWQTGVLPQMGLRLGLPAPSLSQEMSRSPQMVVLTKSVSPADWERIVGYYIARAPAALAEQSRPVQPVVDPPLFATGPFVPGLHSSAIITLLKVDSAHDRIFVGEAASNTLRIFGYDRRLKSTLTLASAPTDVISERDHILVLKVGNLAPNDEPSGSLVRYDIARDGVLRHATTLIDSLYRPVFV